MVPIGGVDVEAKKGCEASVSGRPFARVVDVLAAGAAWDALDLLVEEWRVLRDGRLAEAADRLARAIDPMPPASVPVRVLGGRVPLGRPHSRFSAVMANAGGHDAIEVQGGTFLRPNQEHHPRSTHPLQGATDLEVPTVEVFDHLASLPSDPLLQPSLRRLVADERWVPPSLTSSFWELLERSADPEFGAQIGAVARSPAGQLVLDAMSRLAARRETGAALDAAIIELNSAIDRAIDRVTNLATAAGALVERQSWREPDLVAVFGDWLEESGDPFGQVIAARCAGSDAYQEVEERHRLRWSSRLGPGVAHERTQFVAGGGLSVVVESRAALVKQPPGPFWRLVREMRLPLGVGPDQFTPDGVDCASLAAWLTHPNLDLEVIRGASWILEGMSEAQEPVRVLNIVIDRAGPGISWSNVGFSELRRISGTLTEQELVELVRSIPFMPSLNEVAINASGRWRFSMVRDGNWSFALEQVAPSAGSSIETLRAAVEAIGARRR